MPTPARTMELDRDRLESLTRARAADLLEIARREHDRLTTLNRRTLQVLDWCLADARLKARLLRFLDCLPALASPRSVVRHVREYFPLREGRLQIGRASCRERGEDPVEDGNV